MKLSLSSTLAALAAVSTATASPLIERQNSGSGSGPYTPAVSPLAPLPLPTPLFPFSLPTQPRGIPTHQHTNMIRHPLSLK